MMNLLSDSIFMAGLSAVIGSLITLLVAKNNNKKEVEMHDRIQLSKDQYQLIAELRLMIAQQKEETDSLQDRMRELQEVNISLIIENKNLMSKLDDLNDKLEELEKHRQEDKEEVASRGN